MSLKVSKLLGAMLGAGVVASVMLIPVARGELVYDKNGGAVDDRESMRQALSASHKAQTTQAAEIQSAIEPPAPPAPVQVMVPAPAPVQQAPVVVTQTLPMQQVPVMMQTMPVMQQPIVQQQPVIVPAPQQAPIQQAEVKEVQNLSKAELLRRERLREELRNEDALQERLEALRLRDEKTRVDSVTPATPAAMASITPVKEEVVVAPVTERAPSQTVIPVPASSPAMQTATSMMSTQETGSEDESIILSIMPRAGVSSMLSQSSTGLNVSGRYSGGVGIGASITNNIGIELGYAFSEFGVSSLNSFYGYPYGGVGANPTSETHMLRQNVFDGGLKLYLLGRDARVRPFVGGGAAYARSFINFDSRIVDYYRSIGWTAGRDYELSQFLGYVSAGFDLKLGKNVSIGAIGKYYTVLSARQNQQLYNYAFYNPGLYPYGMAAYNPALTNGYYYDEKQGIGQGLSRAGFFSVLAGLTVNF